MKYLPPMFTSCQLAATPRSKSRRAQLSHVLLLLRVRVLRVLRRVLRPLLLRLRLLRHPGDIFYCAVCLLLVAAVVLLAVLLAAYGFIRHVSITVESASLTRFNLSSPSEATALAYNLSLTLAVRNKNWAMSIKNTKDLEAGYSFDGQRSDNAYAALGNAGVAEFKKENATGVFEVEVAVTGEVRYQAHYTKCKLAATCPLKLQLAPPGTPAVVFQKVKCKLAAADKNC
ncbi:hypothetical protein OsJ_23725 [Oryza sativa Japonica Group]|uniref:Late embryogenesis abundant protein LEA-2 subgroup domain-containing protein n=1 Tax=Oryza sativa subsp. japonica TaxID=39947 RepID=A3BIA1_ORYSJ|nr:hypothetical protein OsJ_23725 [Oryza sativa Japonica Group]